MVCVTFKTSIPCLCNKTHLQILKPPIYGKMVVLQVPNVLTMGSPHTKPPPIRLFKFVWGLLAGTEVPKNEVVDNLPRYGN
jgi:hypothetical protein